jgi:secreted trypsin-like serine protease
LTRRGRTWKIARMSSKIAVVTYFTAALLAGCAAEDPVATGAQPIYGGNTDHGDVNVPLLFYFDPMDSTHRSGFICSSTVVGKRVLLTAAHCVKDNVDANKAADGFVYFGDGDWRTDTANRVALVGARYHRQFIPGVGAEVSTSDVAIVFLAADAPADPVVLNEDPIEGIATPTTNLRSVGWGLTHTMDAGTKHSASVPFVGVGTYDTFYVGDASSGLCQGDSGGPSFIMVGGVEKEAGITSFGFQTGCNDGRSVVARVDKYVHSFIYPSIDNFEGPCKADGVCVTQGCRTADPDCDGCGWDTAHVCNPMCAVPDFDCPIGSSNGAPCDTEFDCETRLCVPAKDDPRLKFCAQECVPSASNCLPEQTCDTVAAQTVCVFKSPSPGAQGANCSSGTQCRSGLCSPGDHKCVEPCDPAQANACPAGYECQESSLAPHVCDTPGSGGGGCGVAGGGSAIGLVLSLLALARRRRR